MRGKVGCQPTPRRQHVDALARARRRRWCPGDSSQPDLAGGRLVTAQVEPGPAQRRCPEKVDQVRLRLDQPVVVVLRDQDGRRSSVDLSLIHISEPTRLLSISYAV